MPAQPVHDPNVLLPSVAGAVSVTAAPESYVSVNAVIPELVLFTSAGDAAIATPLAGFVESTVSVYVVGGGAAVTVTVLELPVAVLYVEELFASGVYVAVIVYVPAAALQAPAATFTVTLPFTKVSDGEVNPVVLSTTDPVGVAPLDPEGAATATVTLNAAPETMEYEDGVTVTTGVTSVGVE